MLNRNLIYAVILLTIVWVILRENAALSSIAAGALISLGCVLACRKLIPLHRTPKINIFRFMIYLLFLLSQVYVAGFHAIKLIVTDAHVEIVEVKTGISGLFLKTILVNSVTLVPGSIALGLNDDNVTILWLKQKEEPLENAQEILLGKLERMLIKCRKGY